GHVVATDIDPRFLARPELAGVEVRRHDILRDLLETRHYDLIHCRALLMHLREPERALARMVAALRPGGSSLRKVIWRHSPSRIRLIPQAQWSPVSSGSRWRRCRPGDASTSTSAGAARSCSRASGSRMSAPS